MQSNNLDKIRQKILKKVSTGKVSMKSRWTFLAQKIGLDSGLLLGFVLAIVFIAFAMYYFSLAWQSDLQEYEQHSWKNILINFPYELLFLGILLILLINWLVKKTDWGYKKTWLTWTLVTSGIVVLIGTLAVKTNIAHHLEKVLVDADIPLVSDYLCDQKRLVDGDRMDGEIIKLGSEVIEFKDTDGKTYKYELDEIKIRPRWYEPKEGDEIEIVGQEEDGEFEIWGVKKKGAEGRGK